MKFLNLLCPEIYIFDCAAALLSKLLNEFFHLLRVRSVTTLVNDEQIFVRGLLCHLLRDTKCASAVMGSWHAKHIPLRPIALIAFPIIAFAIRS